MRIFVTGASGWIGSAVVPELLGAGHQVVGLARSDNSAAAVAAVALRPVRSAAPAAAADVASADRVAPPVAIEASAVGE